MQERQRVAAVRDAIAWSNAHEYLTRGAFGDRADCQSAIRWRERVKADSGVLAEFRGLRLTEPRSVAGRGPGCQGVDERTAGTVRGERQIMGGAAAPPHRGYARLYPGLLPREEGEWFGRLEGCRSTGRCAWSNAHEYMTRGRSVTGPIASRRHAGVRG